MSDVVRDVVRNAIPIRYERLAPSSLSDLKNRSEKVAGREQILTILQTNSCSIDQKSGEIWTDQTLLQPISFKSDRLLVIAKCQYQYINSGSCSPS
ncbi:MAG TPA: hypothetical protein VF780_06275 [Nitrosospira sp.]